MRRDECGTTFGNIAMDYRLSQCKKSFLSDVDTIIDFTKIDRKLKKKYNPKHRLDGSPAYPSLMMFKILLLQCWYNLSDYEAEELLIVRLDFMKFVGLDMESDIPDHSTISRFRSSLLSLNLYDKLLHEINIQLEQQNLLVKSGAIVDASMVESSRRPRRIVQEIPEDRNESEAEGVSHEIKYSSDIDAKWLKKGKKYYYGYKIHVAVDAAKGFILGGHITGANVSDMTELEQVITKSRIDQGTLIFADKGYSSKSNREYIESNNMIDGIMFKAARNKPLTEAEKNHNSVISKCRYKIERTFGNLKQHHGFTRMRYLGLAKAEMEFLLKAMAFNIKKAALQTC